jgi:hypothetical protein
VLPLLPCLLRFFFEMFECGSQSNQHFSGGFK